MHFYDFKTNAMKIAITGANGFVGSHLTNYFSKLHATIVPLGRELFNKDNTSELYIALQGCDVVINLAGASISHRWTEEYKKEIYNSRIETTQILVDTMNEMQKKPALFISTSAVGYYSSEGGHTEANGRMGDGFLATVCHDWEQQARRVSLDVRCVITRFGIVLSKDGGAFPAMIKSTKFKFATSIGNGDSYLSWIDVDDLMRAYNFVIEHGEMSGVINFCAPNPVSGSDFTQAVAKHYHSKLIFKIPKSIFHLILGEQSTLMTDGQRVYPDRLMKAGFRFESGTIKDFLKKTE